MNFTDTILVVDDDPANLQILEATLAPLQIDLALANSGAEALILAEKIKPTLILLDVMMPKMNGYETFEQLKKNNYLKYGQIIFMSALHSGENKAKGLKLGAVDYIGKPFVIDEVIARLNIHLTIHHLTKQLQEHNEQLHNTNQHLLKAVSEGVYGLDLKGCITFVNPAACELTGYQEDQLIGHSFHQMHAPKKINEQAYLYENSPLFQTLSLGRSFKQNEGTFHCLNKSFAVLYSSNPLIKNDKIYGAVIAFQDVSKQHQTFSKLTTALKNATKSTEALRAKNAYLEKEINPNGATSGIIGQSVSLKQAIEAVKKVAPTNTSVLILGESGTGKEGIADLVHTLSTQNKQCLIKVNCGAISPNLIESELFGHEKGAFTGADKRRIGYFELANNGSIFLDEIGELPLDAQVKILRVLQEQEITRVGSGGNPIKIKVRIIAATNRDLLAMITEGTFREDLYYRLNVFPIIIPALRERIEDIPLLANHFMRQESKKLAKNIQYIEANSLLLLQKYHWPGNIRELKNIIERATILSQKHYLNIDSEKVLVMSGKENETTEKTKNIEKQANTPEIFSLAENEKLYILKVLEYTNGVIGGKKGAARLLDIPTSTLRSRIKKLDIQIQKLFY